MQCVEQNEEEFLRVELLVASEHRVVFSHSVLKQQQQQQLNTPVISCTQPWQPHAQQTPHENQPDLDVTQKTKTLQLP